MQDDNDRTLDTNFNVVAVGNRVEQLLQDAGISVIHDKTINDYPLITVLITVCSIS